MKKDASQLRQLEALARLRADAALASVGQARRPLEQAEARVKDLRAHRTALAGSVQDPVQAALMARQVERLRRGEISALQELARHRVDYEKAKDRARPDVGRHIVLQQLIGEQSARERRQK